LGKQFYFHVIGDKEKFEDTDGTILSGPEAAHQQAAVIAAELALAGESRDFFICVVDEDENEVVQVPVSYDRRAP
jgi:hypothetical protein